MQCAPCSLNTDNYALLDGRVLWMRRLRTQDILDVEQISSDKIGAPNYLFVFHKA